MYLAHCLFAHDGAQRAASKICVNFSSSIALLEKSRILFREVITSVKSNFVTKNKQRNKEYTNIGE